MGLRLSECLTAYGATPATLGEIEDARPALQEAVEADPQNRIAQPNIEVLSAGSSEGIQTGLIPIENQPLEGMRF
jgi:hypothetical protein